MTAAELKALALAATPGEPWFAKKPRAGRTPRIAYIAALSPERILALIACVEAADAMEWEPTHQSRSVYRGLRAALEAAP